VEIVILNELGKLYSIEIVAELLDVEEQTIRKWIKEGKIKALKLAGTTLKVSETELEKFVLQAYYHSSKGGK
jgi:excisionase family DNA binding protein